ncbi:MAG: hypothetical protein ACYDDF_00375 [Thermoplasmatota archaeon]
MKRARRAFLVILCLGGATTVLAAFTEQGSAAGAGPAARTYVGTPGDLTAVCYEDGHGIVYHTTGGLLIASADPSGAGGACWSVPVNTSVVSMQVADDLVPRVGFWIQYADASNQSIGAAFGPFCGSGSAMVPAGATQVYGTVDQAFGLLDCGSGPATTGTITATFS